LLEGKKDTGQKVKGFDSAPYRVRNSATQESAFPLEKPLERALKGFSFILL